MTSNREVVERYWRALADHDFDTAYGLLHEDFVSRWPQSGEVIRGPANARAIVEGWPGGGVTAAVGKIIGQDEEYVLGPSWNIVHVAGTGDEFFGMGTVTYPNGETWHDVGVVTVRDGKIWRVVEYFAPSFDPAEWRRPYVEIEDA